MIISKYISALPDIFSSQMPWQSIANLSSLISDEIKKLPDDYIILDNIARHKSSIIEQGAITKGPCIIGPDCFIAAYAYLRDGVWLEGNNIIGPAVEIKSSFLGKNSKAAHFNFIGDSIIGTNTNMEAGSIIANHRNELEEKEITCIDQGTSILTGTTKFGALIGDNCKIGANAVLAPGTLLPAGTIVERLTLIDHLRG